MTIPTTGPHGQEISEALAKRASYYRDIKDRLSVLAKAAAEGAESDDPRVILASVQACQMFIRDVFA